MSKNKHDNKHMHTKRKDIGRVNALEPNNDDNNTNDTSKLKRIRSDDIGTTINSSMINDNISIVKNSLTSSNKHVRLINQIDEVDSGNNTSSSSFSYSNNTDIILPKDVLQISWKKIVIAFTLMFNSIFAANSRLYLDVVSEIIDGASAKWCPLIILDTLISIFADNSIKFKYNETLKRRFNQYHVLHKAVCDVVSEVYVANSFNSLIKSNDNNDKIFPINIDIIDVPNEWFTNTNFINHTFHLIPSTKSNQKMNEVVNNLISHNIIKENGILFVIKTVVSNIYIQHFNTV